jgi:hypothetical protein
MLGAQPCSLCTARHFTAHLLQSAVAALAQLHMLRIAAPPQVTLAKPKEEQEDPAAAAPPPPPVAAPQQRRTQSQQASKQQPQQPQQPATPAARGRAPAQQQQQQQQQQNGQRKQAGGSGYSNGSAAGAAAAPPAAAQAPPRDADLTQLNRVDQWAHLIAYPGMHVHRWVCATLLKGGWREQLSAQPCMHCGFAEHPLYQSMIVSAGWLQAMEHMHPCVLGKAVHPSQHLRNTLPCRTDRCTSSHRCQTSLVLL